MVLFRTSCLFTTIRDYLRTKCIIRNKSIILEQVNNSERLGNDNMHYSVLNMLLKEDTLFKTMRIVSFRTICNRINLLKALP